MDMNYLLKQLENPNEVAFFLGAGFSLGPKVDGTRVGLGSGEELAQYLAKNVLDRDVGKMTLVDVCDECEFLDKAKFRQTLQDYLSKGQVQQCHKYMVDIINDLNFPKDFVLTVNVDDLLERAAQERGISLPKVISDHDFNTAGDKVYIKIHGCITNIHQAVFTTQDFLYVDQDNAIFDKLQTIFRERSVIFIGFGMNDVDILRLLYRLTKNGKFTRNNYLVVPKGSNWSIARERHYIQNFNMTHIDMTAEEFLAKVQDQIKKKRNLESIIEQLRNVSNGGQLSEPNVNVLLENLDAIKDHQLLIKLLIQCVKIDKVNLQRVFHVNLNDPILSYKLSVMMCNESHSTSTRTSMDGVPVNISDIDAFSVALRDVPSSNYPFVSEYLLKTNLVHSNLVSTIFANIIPEQLSNTVISLVNSNPIEALTGLMYNSSIQLIEHLLTYTQSDMQSDVKTLLQIRHDQLLGTTYDTNVTVDSIFSVPFRLWEQQNKELISKNKALWPQHRGDSSNTNSTKYSIQRAARTKEMKILPLQRSNFEPSRVLIGNGFIVTSGDKPLIVQFISTNQKFNLDVGIQAVICDNGIIASEPYMVVLYDFGGRLKKIEPVDSNISMPPKLLNNGTIMVVCSNGIVKQYTNELNLLKSFNIAPSQKIVDFIEFAEGLIFATPTAVIVLRNHEDSTEIRVEGDIETLLADSTCFYVVCKQRIFRYSFDGCQLDRYTLVADRQTDVSIIQDGFIAYGHQRTVVIVEFGNGSPNQSRIDIDNNETILDLIVCDGKVSVLGSKGSLYILDGGNALKLGGNPNITLGALSAGAGTVCVRTSNTVYCQC